MSRELIPRIWCDRCDAAERRTAGTHTYTVGLVSGENRPALKVLDLCDDCDAWLAEMQDLLSKHTYPLDPPKPSAPAPSFRSGDSVICEICSATLGRGAIVGHIWNVHRAGETRPAPPARCPECRAVFSAAGMGMHRSRTHGWSAVAEAYAGVTR